MRNLQRGRLLMAILAMAVSACSGVAPNRQPEEPIASPTPVPTSSVASFRHPPSLATGECVQVGIGAVWNEVVVVPCALLEHEHVYRVAEIMFGEVAHGEGTESCPPGVDYEMFSLGTKIEGVVMPDPARLFCLFE